MHRLAIGCLCLILAGSFYSQIAYADELQVSVGQQGDQSLQRPINGMNIETVEMKYGAPEIIKGPIGDPPITTWEYKNFSVYFEYELVIHTVLHK